MRIRRALYLAGIVAAGCVVYLTAQQARNDVLDLRDSCHVPHRNRERAP
jgi:hypothetical protein